MTTMQTIKNNQSVVTGFTPADLNIILQSGSIVEVWEPKKELGFDMWSFKFSNNELTFHCRVKESKLEEHGLTGISKGFRITFMGRQYRQVDQVGHYWVVNQIFNYHADKDFPS